MVRAQIAQVWLMVAHWWMIVALPSSIHLQLTLAVAFIDNAEDAQIGPNEIVVLPDDPSNPFKAVEILGCTDSTACNFNFLATIDDGTCGILDDSVNVKFHIATTLYLTKSPTQLWMIAAKFGLVYLCYPAP